MTADLKPTLSPEAESAIAWIKDQLGRGLLNDDPADDAKVRLILSSLEAERAENERLRVLLLGRPAGRAGAGGHTVRRRHPLPALFP